jgi:hypothetical protein
VSRRTCGFELVCFLLCTRGRGCARRTGIPCALLFPRDKLDAQLGQIVPRECGSLPFTFSLVIPGRREASSPESITMIGSMDSGPAPKGASRNDDGKERMPRPCDIRPGGGPLRAHRSAGLTIFWRCEACPFSSRTASRCRGRQRTVNGFGRRFWRLQGSGNADSQRKVRSSGWSGFRRPCASGCDHAHPASWRASPSYRPLRAVWAVCAWALRGCARTPKPFSAHVNSASTQKEFMP